MSEQQIDLAGEFAVARDRVDLKHVQWLRRQGVGDDGLFSGHDFSFGVAEIEVQSDSSWMFMPGGREAMIVPNWGDDDPDLMAFFPGAPEVVFRRAGRAVIAGRDQISQLLDRIAVDLLPPDGPEWCGCATLTNHLHVWPTLIAWMRARYVGVVVIDWTQPLHYFFHGVPEVRIADRALALRLESALLRPFAVPRFLVSP